MPKRWRKSYEKNYDNYTGICVYHCCGTFFDTNEQASGRNFACVNTHGINRGIGVILSVESCGNTG